MAGQFHIKPLTKSIGFAVEDKDGNKATGETIREATSNYKEVRKRNNLRKGKQ